MKRLILVLVAAALAACGGDGPPAGPSMEDRSFTPETREVSAGEVVVWVNDSDEAHTITAEAVSLPEGAAYFSSGGSASEEEAIRNLSDELIDPGETFEWKFDEPGTYRYYCIPHRSDGMEGSVEVQ